MTVEKMHSAITAVMERSDGRGPHVMYRDHSQMLSGTGVFTVVYNGKIWGKFR